MEHIHNALELFANCNELEKTSKDSDNLWEIKYGPAIIFLEKRKLVDAIYCNEVDYPIYGSLNAAGREAKRKYLMNSK